MTSPRPLVALAALLLAALLAPACQPHLAAVESDDDATEARVTEGEQLADGGVENDHVAAIDRDPDEDDSTPVEIDGEDRSAFPRLAARSRLFDSARGALRERRRR